MLLQSSNSQAESCYQQASREANTGTATQRLWCPRPPMMERTPGLSGSCCTMHCCILLPPFCFPCLLPSADGIPLVAAHSGAAAVLSEKHVPSARDHAVAFCLLQILLYGICWEQIKVLSANSVPQQQEERLQDVSFVKIQTKSMQTTVYLP